MNVTVAVTGASGALLAQQLLRALEADARVSGVDFVASEGALRVIAEELHLSGRHELLEKLLGAVGKEDAAACRAGYRRVDCERQLSVGGDDRASLLHGDAGRHCERHGGESDRAGGGCVPEGAAAAAALRARDAIQQDPPAQHAACCGCRGDDLSGDSRPSTTSRLRRPRWFAILWIGCWRTSGCRSRTRTSGSRALNSKN